MSVAALHTRAICDECRDIPATREVEGGIIVCERCDTTPAANDDALGALLGGMLRATPLCSRCSNPAFLRVDETIVLCPDCWLRVDAHLENDSSFAVAAFSGENVTVAVKPTPDPSATVTPLSRDCASRSSETTKGDRPGTEEPALETLQRLEPAGDLESTLGGACGSERDGFGATNSNSNSCGSTTRPCTPGIRLETIGTRAGNPLTEQGDSSPQDSTPALPQGGSPVTVAAHVRGLAATVTPIFDLETDALVSGLEAGWILDRRNSSTSRVVAAINMASADNPKSEIRGA
jgi:ribosomal protein L37AE/L43A